MGTEHRSGGEDSDRVGACWLLRHSGTASYDCSTDDRSTHDCSSYDCSTDDCSADDRSTYDCSADDRSGRESGGHKELQRFLYPSRSASLV